MKSAVLPVLRQAGWLKESAPGLPDALLAEGRIVHRDAGQWAQAEGDERGGLFILIEGLLHSYCAGRGGREVLLGMVEPGAILGHATRFSGGPRLVTAICVEPATLLEISEAALERVAEHCPDIWRAIAVAAYDNMRSALRMAADLLTLTPRQRLAGRLAAAAERMTGETLPIRQDMLGEMTGLSRKTVNGHLAAFARAGLVRTGYGRIIVLDPAGLRAVAGLITK